MVQWQCQVKIISQKYDFDKFAQNLDEYLEKIEYDPANIYEKSTKKSNYQKTCGPVDVLRKIAVFRNTRSHGQWLQTLIRVGILVVLRVCEMMCCLNFL